MTLKYIKKETVGLLAFGVVVIILVIIGRIDWLGYKVVDTAKSKCMMAYLNLKQAVLELPANENELAEFVEDVCSKFGRRAFGRAKTVSGSGKIMNGNKRLI